LDVNVTIYLLRFMSESSGAEGCDPCAYTAPEVVRFSRTGTIHPRSADLVVTVMNPLYACGSARNLAPSLSLV
jgi:hypothetical protein